MSTTDELFSQGIAAYQAGHFDEAESAFTQVLTYEPFSSETLLNLGNVYYRQEKMDQAEETWLKTLAINPIEEKAYLNLGNLYYAQQRYNKAVYYWEIFKKLDPLHANIYLNLGLAYEAMADLPKAFSNYNHYLKSSGGKNKGANSVELLQLKNRLDHAKLIAENNVKVAESLMQTGRLAAAKDAYEKSVMIYPLHPRIYKHYATVLYKLQNHQAALEWYEKAFQNLPGDTGLLINLGVLHEKAGDALQALWAYNLTLKLDPGGIPGKVRKLSQNLWDKYGEALIDDSLERIQHEIERGHYLEAERLAQRLFDVAFPLAPQKLPEVKTIIQFLDDRKNPKKLAADIAYAMAEDFRTSGQYEKAIRFYERYLSITPEGKRAEEVRARLEEMQKVISAVVGSLLADDKPSPSSVA